MTKACRQFLCTRNTYSYLGKWNWLPINSKIFILFCFLLQEVDFFFGGRTFSGKILLLSQTVLSA